MAVAFCLPPLTAWAEMALVPQTGQTTCYDSDGAVIPCAGTGQDGDDPQGVPWPEPRFVDNQDGTITDNLTGLVWLKNADCTDTLGGIAKTNEYLTWADAVAWSNALASGKCGLTDGSTAGQWRLPNIKEIKSLVNRQQSNLLIWLKGFGFNLHVGTYWSSTTNARGSDIAWDIGMDNGLLGYSGKHYSWYVWPVRSGQSQSATIKLPRTGQTSTYAPADDGALQKGVVWPIPRFMDLADGTVYDNLTGLIWLKNANCLTLRTGVLRSLSPTV